MQIRFFNIRASKNLYSATYSITPCMNLQIFRNTMCNINECAILGLMKMLRLDCGETE